MSKSILKIVDELPTINFTVRALKSLDFAIPGEWDNPVGFENTIKLVTGETDKVLIQLISDQAMHLYNDQSQGYQRAMWLYESLDSHSVGVNFLARKASPDVSIPGLLDNLTPKPEKSQSIDLCIKLVVELVAFCQINGIPSDSISDFVASLEDYSGESLVRMVALVCFDGLIPLGPDFALKGLNTLKGLNPSDLGGNPVFKSVSELIPGGNDSGKLKFITQSFESATGWINGFVGSHDLTPGKVANNLANFVEISKDKLEYLGAFLDVSTNYYYHTGAQTVARRLIERAISEI